MFKAEEETASIEIACGDEAETEGPASLQTCGAAAGEILSFILCNMLPS